jgi:hypothetical protein
LDHLLDHLYANIQTTALCSHSQIMHHISLHHKGNPAEMAHADAEE